MSLFQPGADGPCMVRLSLSFPDSMIRLYCHNLKIKHIVSNYTSIIVHCTHIKQASSSLIKSFVSNLDNTYKKDVPDVLAIIRYLFGNKNIVIRCICGAQSKEPVEPQINLLNPHQCSPQQTRCFQIATHRRIMDDNFCHNPNEFS